MLKTKTAPVKVTSTSIIFEKVKTKIFKIKYAEIKNLTEIDRDFLESHSLYCEFHHFTEAEEISYLIDIDSLDYMPLSCIRHNANIELVKFIDNVRLERAEYTHVEFYVSNDVES